MKLPLILFFLTCLTTSGNGQTIENRVDNFVRQEKIDSFLVYGFFHDGSLPIDSCHLEEPRYVFWLKEKQWFVKRFDYCHTYKTARLDSISPFQFYLQHRTVIDKEEIKQPTYYQTSISRGKHEVLTVTSTGLSHSYFHKFQFFAALRSKNLYVDQHDLEFKQFDNGRKNIHYASNQKTRLNSLIAMTTKLINHLKTENLFMLE